VNERACVIFYALVCSFSFSFFLCCFTLIKFSYVNFILIFFFFSNSLRIFKVKCIRNKIFFVTNTTRKFFTLFESVFCYEQNIFTLIFLWFPYHTYTRTYHVYIINPFVLLFFLFISLPCLAFFFIIVIDRHINTFESHGKFNLGHNSHDLFCFFFLIHKS